MLTKMLLQRMSGSVICSGLRVIRTQNVRRRLNNIRKVSMETWRRVLHYGGLTSTTVALGARLMIPPSFEHEATKLQLGAMQTTSHEHLIRQASTMAVDAATQLLSQTVVAYIEMSHMYRDVLKELLDILSDDLQLVSLENISDENNQALDLTQELWEQEMDCRQRANALRSSLMELSSYMEYVTKVATSAAEASYLAGSDFASTSMCERLNSAHRAFEEEKAKNKEADRELLRLQESHATLGKSTEESTLSPTLARRKMTWSGMDIPVLDPLGEIEKEEELSTASSSSESSSGNENINNPNDRNNSSNLKSDE